MGSGCVIQHHGSRFWLEPQLVNPGYDSWGGCFGAVGVGLLWLFGGSMVVVG